RAERCNHAAVDGKPACRVADVEAKDSSAEIGGIDEVIDAVAVPVQDFNRGGDGALHLRNDEVRAARSRAPQQFTIVGPDDIERIADGVVDVPGRGVRAVLRVRIVAAAEHEHGGWRAAY